MAWFINRFSGTAAQQTCTAAAKSDNKDEEDDEDDDDDDDDDEDDDEKEVSCVASPVNVEPVDRFDVIIMDALDPQDNVGFADILYSSDIFFTSLYNALTDDGVLIMQLGEAAYLNDPPEEYTDSKNKANIVDKLSRKVGFQSVHEYQEPHCGFLDSWTFMVGCKNARSCHKQWYSNAASKQLDIHRRLRKPSDKSKTTSLLNYVDGVILEAYRVPHKAHEEMYCRSPNAPPDCWLGRGYYPSSDTIGFDSVTDVNRDGSELVLTAKVDITKGYFITNGGLTMAVDRSTVDQLQNSPTNQVSTAFSPFLAASDAMKFAGVLPSSLPIILSLDNRSEGTPNLGSITTYIAQEGLCGGKGDECHKTAHNVVVDRHLSTYGAGTMIALTDILAGNRFVLAKR
mmetsp:Transcript_10612/g.15330  ORF Transcript_10612/g.15330 Transcript_10612/m.15330 type:complete len:399 (+) Transcript_10612:920-2116(+)